MRKVIICFLLLISGIAPAQELNCVVQINSAQVTKTNQQVFRTLEKALNELVNKTKWTDQTYKQKERIECSMFITVTSNNQDQFAATIQVQSSRPVFNTNYATPVFNFNDKDFNFKYTEFENLFFDPNSFDSNLVSVLAFYSYLIIGMDEDTFSPLGGTKSFTTAQGIASLAQQSSYKGWSQIDGNQNRFFLINDLLSTTFSTIRETIYTYHSQGLDNMNDDLKLSKEKVKSSLMSLEKIYALRPNAFLTRVFFDAKAEEIQAIFSGGPKMDIADLIGQLNRFSPINATKWAAIKF